MASRPGDRAADEIVFSPGWLVLLRDRAADARFPGRRALAGQPAWGAGRNEVAGWCAIAVVPGGCQSSRRSGRRSGCRPPAVAHDRAAADLGEAAPGAHGPGRGDQVHVRHVLLPRVPSSPGEIAPGDRAGVARMTRAPSHASDSGTRCGLPALAVATHASASFSSRAIVSALRWLVLRTVSAMPSRPSGRFRGPVTPPIPGRQALIFPGRRETLNSAGPGHSEPEHRAGQPCGPARGCRLRIVTRLHAAVLPGARCAAHTCAQPQVCGYGM